MVLVCGICHSLVRVLKGLTFLEKKQTELLRYAKGMDTSEEVTKNLGEDEDIVWKVIKSTQEDSNESEWQWSYTQTHKAWTQE